MMMMMVRRRRTTTAIIVSNEHNDWVVIRPLLLLLFVVVAAVVVAAEAGSTGESSSSSSASLSASSSQSSPSSSQHNTPRPRSSTSRSRNGQRKLFLLLDVDNTLYDESSAKIEYQIVRNTHEFCHSSLREGFDFDPSGLKADELFRQYGSTVEGLRQTVWKDCSSNGSNTIDDDEEKEDGRQQQHPQRRRNHQMVLRDNLKRFYEEVYHPRRIDVSSLLLLPTTTATTTTTTTTKAHQHEDGTTETTSAEDSSSTSSSSTGYTHATFDQQRLVRRLLKSLSGTAVAGGGGGTTTSPFPLIGLASNSPSWHIRRVLNALGLATLYQNPKGGGGGGGGGGGIRRIYTPDIPERYRNGNHDSSGRLLYPTKHDPVSFFEDDNDGNRNSLLLHNNDHNGDSLLEVAFFDDSIRNLRRVQDAFPSVINRIYHVCNDYSQQKNNSNNKNTSSDKDGNNPTEIRTTATMTLSEALLEVLGLVEPQTEYKFCQVKYLESKNEVDRRSIDTKTWNYVISKLEQRWSSKEKKKRNNNNNNSNNKNDGERAITDDDNDNVDDGGSSPLVIIDLGAGLLSILDLMIHGNSETGLKSLLPLSSSIQSNQLDQSKSMLNNANKLQYIAYESNSILVDEIRSKLKRWGFVMKSSTGNASGIETIIFQHKDNGNIEIKLILGDFMSIPSPTVPYKDLPPDLIVGCCFADLIEPEKLVTHLISRFHLLDGISDRKEDLDEDTLIYFPITFSGTTQFLPPQPFEFITNLDDATSTSSRSEQRTIPSDTKAFQLYSDALISTLGHNLDPKRIILAMNDHGVELVSSSPSDWKINPESDFYLYETMLYFFGSTGGPRLLEEGWDASGWIQRARTTRPSIQVSNQDLLFRMPFMNIESASSDFQVDPIASSVCLSFPAKEILFTAPYQVSTVDREIMLTDIGPRDVLIKSTCSLISSGTELKIFKGLFDQDAALDVNIKDMEGERMNYPLSYGYCLVGRVVECGSDVPKDKYQQGDLVFTFSPHASYVLTNMDAIQRVPGGIDPFDAVFMPSIETALSLIHDAQVQLGENVGIFGQGLIGLLITKILKRESSNASNMHQLIDSEKGELFDSLTVFDMIPERLALASRLGASQALFPRSGKGHEASLKFDVTIEVSGNARALQAAIDQTLDGGRIILGSWYGNRDIPLKLGIDFHRSHKVIQTSQVSEIPARLTRLWSKQRRFSLTWQLVRELQPSKLGLLTKICGLGDAPDAYQALDSGAEVAVAFDYSA